MLYVSNNLSTVVLPPESPDEVRSDGDGGDDTTATAIYFRLTRARLAVIEDKLKAIAKGFQGGAVKPETYRMARDRMKVIREWVGEHGEEVGSDERRYQRDAPPLDNATASKSTPGGTATTAAQRSEAARAAKARQDERDNQRAFEQWLWEELHRVDEDGLGLLGSSLMGSRSVAVIERLVVVDPLGRRFVCDPDKFSAMERDLETMRKIAQDRHEQKVREAAGTDPASRAAREKRQAAKAKTPRLF